MASAKSERSVFKTTIPKVFYNFKWILENYSEIKRDVEIRSPEFKPQHDMLWHATLEKKIISKVPHIILCFYNHSNDQYDITVNVMLMDKNDVAIANQLVDRYDQKTSEVSRAIFFKMEYYKAPNFYSSNYYNLQHFPGDILVLLCQMTFLKYVTVTESYNCISPRIPSKVLNSLSNDLKKVYESSIGTDVNLKIQGSNIFAHKTVLTARSDVFSKMFQSDLKENSTEVVEITDIEPHIFKLFLEYMYTDVCPATDFNSAQALYSVSDKYCVSNLKQMIVSALSSHMTVENAVELLFFAHLYKEIDLQKEVITFIKSHDKEFPIVETVRKLVLDERCDSDFGALVKALF